jgi:hypothetical protein
MDAERYAADREDGRRNERSGPPATLTEEDRRRYREGGGGVVAGKARVGGVGGEEMDAVGIGDEGSDAVDQFADHFADRKAEAGAEHCGHRGPAPSGVSCAAGGEEDDHQRRDEERLGGIDVEEEGILDRVVLVHEVVQGVQDGPIHRRNAVTTSLRRAKGAGYQPTHVQGRHADGEVRYSAPSLILEHPDGRQLEVGGFQPFEVYDNALANLDGGLERRPAPECAVEVVREFPIGLTTAEVASIMRPSDLKEADPPGTERELIAAADAGELVCEPAGSDALWRPPRAGEAGGAGLPRAA